VHRGPTISEIQAVVADYFHVTRAALTGHRRTREIVRPRQIAIYLAKTITQRSLPEIGRRFGYRDHSTALHSVRQIAKLCKLEVGVAYDVALLEARFQ
jgi:chromosomal replication initiator protein